LLGGERCTPASGPGPETTWLFGVGHTAGGLHTVTPARGSEVEDDVLCRYAAAYGLPGTGRLCCRAETTRARVRGAATRLGCLPSLRAVRDRISVIDRRLIPTPRGIVSVMDVTRAATARRLADELMRLAIVAAALADAEVWELTRERGSARRVAAALGVTEASVRKAVQQHNRRQKGLSVRRT
jgi:hypothetical protein